MKKQKKKAKLKSKCGNEGSGNHLNTIRMENAEDTDMEIMQERKEILMTEMECILDTLLAKEKRRKDTCERSSREKNHEKIHKKKKRVKKELSKR